MTLPPLIHRHALQASWGCSTQAMRDSVARGDLPPYDVHVGKVIGWYPQTLRDAGVCVPDVEPAAKEAA